MMSWRDDYNPNDDWNKVIGDFGYVEEGVPPFTPERRRQGPTWSELPALSRVIAIVILGAAAVTVAMFILLFIRIIVFLWVGWPV